VSVSSISAFEIALSHKKGKLELPCDPDKWYHGVLTHHDIIEIKLNRKIALTSTKLTDHHKDPCDRFIIATAILNHFPIITKGNLFERYGVKVYS
jgi:PIN domain nuclease of toxin-antitoxin system